MTIRNVQAQQSQKSLNFNGRFFDKGGKQLKSFGLFDEFSKMELRGGKNTDIQLRDVFSKENPMGDYDISVKVAVENPLFGRQEVIAKNCNQRNSPVKSISEELEHFNIATGLYSNNSKTLEDTALRQSLIDIIKEKSDNLSPIKIFNNLLGTAQNHGFSEDRIKDFSKVAENLNDELISNGVKSVEK